MYLNTRIVPITGYARVLLFMFIRRELGGTGTGCLFQFTYCVGVFIWVSLQVATAIYLKTKIHISCTRDSPF